MRSKLKKLNAKSEGIDHQIDTYFENKKGKLKLRQGNIENGLIFYDRQKKKGPKLSSVIAYMIENDGSDSLKEILIKVLNVCVVVDKKREIFWIDNVKFHLDQVARLGNFVEIEAIDYHGTIGKKKLLEQCSHYLATLGIDKNDLITDSYSDMLLAKQK